MGRDSGTGYAGGVDFDPPQPIRPPEDIKRSAARSVEVSAEESAAVNPLSFAIEHELIHELPPPCKGGAHFEGQHKMRRLDRGALSIARASANPLGWQRLRANNLSRSPFSVTSSASMAWSALDTSRRCLRPFVGRWGAHKITRS